MENKNIVKSVFLMAIVVVVGFFVLRGVGWSVSGQTARVTGDCKGVTVWPILPTDGYVSNISSGSDAEIADFAVVNNSSCSLRITSISILNISPNNSSNLGQGAVYKHYSGGTGKEVFSTPSYDFANKTYKISFSTVSSMLIMPKETALYTVESPLTSTIISAFPERFALLANAFNFETINGSTNFQIKPTPLLPREFVVQPASSVACSTQSTQLTAKLDPTSPSGSSFPNPGVKLQVFNLTANAYCDIRIDQISFNINPSSSAQYLGAMKLYDGAKQIGSTIITPNDPVTFTLNSGELTISPATTKTLTLKADVKTNIPWGTTIQSSVKSLNAVDNVEAITITKIIGLPLNGGVLTFNAIIN